MDIQPLLAEAKRLLKSNPRDKIHDLSHHQRVWENAQQICSTVKDPFDKQALQVAVMWHDVMISDQSRELGSEGILEETTEYLVKLMEKHSYPAEFQQTVLEAVKHHNFLTRWQRNTEGKILFDADKLDALNPIRYRQIMDSISGKELSKPQILLYAQAAKLWLGTMRRRYHFTKSKQLHDELITNLLKDSKAIQMAKQWGVDIKKLVS